MIKKYFCILIATILITSCLQDNYQNKLDEFEQNVDLNFSFKTRTDIDLTVSAYNYLDEPSSGVLFSVYTDYPYLEDGNRNSAMNPIYQGYTESNGSLHFILPVPTNSTSLYIIPEFGGYGTMQVVPTENATNVKVELRGIGINTKSSPSQFMTRSSLLERERINCGNNYKFYTYFSSSEYATTTGVLNSPSELVSYEPLSNEFLSLTNSWFPDLGMNYNTNLNPDIQIIEDGTEVWITYIGDGGFSVGSRSDFTSLMYFTYTDSTLPSGYYSKPQLVAGLLPITYAIINANALYTPQGTKVQLLYWNGSKYVSEFPAGTKIGFGFLYRGYGTVNNPKFSLDEQYFKYSTPSLNKDGLSHAVSMWSDKFQCFIVGMEFNATSDADYNDILFKFNTSKIASISSSQAPPTAIAPQSSYQGTIAFEDLWPYTGDYDFNDFVTTYKYDIVKQIGSNNVSALKLTFSPQAIGATKENGFGIQLPILASNIARIEGATLESGNVLATIIALPNVRDTYNGRSGIINSFKNIENIESTPVEITIYLASAVTETSVPFYGFNPFLFDTDNRGCEIHLTDYAPTLLANMSYFGSGADCSIPKKGIYYRMANMYPWAIDIAGSVTWRHPVEMTNITSAYLKYNQWVSDKSNLSWFDWNQEGYANTDLLY